MRKIYPSLAVALFLSLTAVSQPFTPINMGLPGITRGATAFADFNNDGALDLVMIGMDNTFNPLGKIFMNNNGTFEEVNSGITGLYNSALSIADYDHDGLLDIVMTGEDFDGPATKLYRNTGNLLFQLIDAPLYPAGADGDILFGDYNKDGFADIVISGNWATKLYRNQGDGSFVEVQAGLPALNSPSLSWGDYDNDGDLDLLLVGDDGSITTYIMTNHEGEFTRLEMEIEGAVGGSARWGDYDMDGYLDILITGKDYTLTPVSHVYRNNGNYTFSYANAGFVGTALGPADWIDFDNDGDLDAMLSGQNAGCGNASTRLYQNDGVGFFNEYPAGLAFVERAASAWGDFDNDGDIDLLLTGTSVSATTIFYRNDLNTGTFQPNTNPSVPVISSVYNALNYVVISWERASDMQSPSMALSYNFRMGTESGGINVVTPNSDVTTGFRYIPSTGNMGTNNYAVLMNLEPATYYFSVQSVDQAFAGSPFCEEQSFVVLPTSIDPTGTTVDIRIEQFDSELRIINPSAEKANVSIYSISGRLMVKKMIHDQTTLSTSNLPSGMYILTVTLKGNTINKKWIKR